MMRPSQIRGELAAARDEDAESELATKLREQAQLPGSTLVELWQGPDEELSERALGAMIDLGASSIVPLLATEGGLEPADRVQALQLSVEAELALRQRVLKALDAMLDDRRPLPGRPQLAPTERAAPEKRVCDEAYLLIRKLVHFGEDELDAIVDGDAFLSLPDEQRDAAIAEARRTQTWNRLQIDEVEF